MREDEYVLDLRAIDPEQHELVGGKAAGLAALIRLGERVPEGFCVTTEAYRLGEVPRDEVLAAYERLGGGPVAVRSSATAEDLPHASFAGQQDTWLSVSGTDDLLEAIRACWTSLHTERARAYREAAGISHDGVRMAVVVQRMIEVEVAGVLFTANPVTGSRRETVVDAALGPGTAVVDGAAAADHYVLDGSKQQAHRGPARGCLTPARLAELRETGARLEGGFGAEQDIEWAYDRDGMLWLLQSRPMTALFPAPPRSSEPGPRLYVEFGHVQGMLQPATPMGVATLKSILAGMLASFGFTVEIVDIGGRLYGDLTDAMRDPAGRHRLVKLMAVDFGPRAQAVVEHLLDDPRFTPRRSARRPSAAALMAGPKAVGGILRALARPEAARARVFGEIERLRRRSVTDPAMAAELLDLLDEDGAPPHTSDAVLWPVVSGLLVSAALPPLLKGIAGDDEIHTVLGGMPHNVTIEMDLALWQVAQRAAPYRKMLLDTPPDKLAAAQLRGELPDFGMAEFLDAYGIRSAAEVDVGVPRWSEDPTPVFAMLAGCLRVTDPEQAPDRRFERAAIKAEETVTELARRARDQRPLRGRIAGFFLRRARELTGLREAVRERRSTHERELRRRTVPVALLCDGTDAETLLPARTTDGRTLTGVGAASGRVSGRARVVRDPASASIEPGEILVAPTTDPGWTPLFLTAGGLVTETGAVLAHGPTVAREYGIPAVICVPYATERLRTGQLITMDGAAGTITLGQDAAALGVGRD
jgi:rifampicin phosphotransferase